MDDQVCVPLICGSRQSLILRHQKTMSMGKKRRTLFCTVHAQLTRDCNLDCELAARTAGFAVRVFQVECGPDDASSRTADQTQTMNRHQLWWTIITPTRPPAPDQTHPTALKSVLRRPALPW